MKDDLGSMAVAMIVDKAPVFAVILVTKVLKLKLKPRGTKLPLCLEQLSQITEQIDRKDTWKV